MSPLKNISSYYFLIAPLCLALIIISPNLMANTREYIASFTNSKWDNKSEKLYCELRHEIPQYGEIIFFQDAGEASKSHLLIKLNRGITYQQGEILFQSPKWQHSKQPEPGWKFQFPEVESPIIFSERQSRRILDSLNRGFITTIKHRDNANRRQEIIAKLAPINFQKPYLEYTECQNNIIPITFNELNNSSVYFENNSTKLTRDTLKWLDYLIAYAEDPDLRAIELSGYTDSIGSFRANHKLASDRTQSVLDYITTQGVSSEIIKVKVYGERDPIGKNNSKHGRALNRRVKIKVWR